MNPPPTSGPNARVKPSSDQTTVTIAIEKNGDISLDGKNVTDQQLVDALAAVHNYDEDTPVLIKADESSQVKKLAFVMDACRQAHLNKINIQSR